MWWSFQQGWLPSMSQGLWLLPISIDANTSCAFYIALCTKSKAQVLEDVCGVLKVRGVNMGSAGDCSFLGRRKLDLLPGNSVVLEVPHQFARGWSSPTSRTCGIAVQWWQVTLLIFVTGIIHLPSVICSHQSIILNISATPLHCFILKEHCATAENSAIRVHKLIGNCLPCQFLTGTMLRDARIVLRSLWRKGGSWRNFLCVCRLRNTNYLFLSHHIFKRNISFCPLFKLLKFSCQLQLASRSSRSLISYPKMFVS